MKTDRQHDIWAAVGDGTRRAIVLMLAAGPLSVGALAARLPVTRSAVSQHLKALKGAGLVTHRSEGTRHVYYIDPEGLGELRRWLDGFWTDALESFKNEVAAASGASERKKHEPHD